ncbi:MAG: virulence protein [Lachnospiraceae bacterium]|nr:virulence protein [Lachnospiraceae bacterium]
MEARYNLTGKERKALVKAIESIIHEPAVYKMTPTFEYTVGEFTIDKNGIVTCEDRDALERLIHNLIGEGYRPEEDMTDTTAQVEPPEAINLTVEIPFDKVNVGNLTKLLDAKGDLIKKALGIDDIRIEMKEDRVAFPWFTEVEPDVAMAYTNFIAALCRMSKEAKRVTATQKEVGNEKYAFRCFLLRLGFIGTEYKKDRKILLQNLTGSSAFRNKEATE